MMQDVGICGVVPVLSTPFGNDESIDSEVLASEIRWISSFGITTVATGMVSEILRMSELERHYLVDQVCGASRDLGVQAVVSCGLETTRRTIEMVRHAEDAGAFGVMINPPISTSLSDQETYVFYSKIFEETNVPIVVQDASGYVGRPIDLDVLVRLSHEYETRIYFKPEAVPIGQRLTALLDRTQGLAKVIEGTGGANLVDSYNRGIVGTMPGVDICWAILRLWTALETDNWPLANQISGVVANLVNLMPNLGAYIAIEKHLLVRQGVFLNENKMQPTGYEFDVGTIAECERLFEYLQTICTDN